MLKLRCYDHQAKNVEQWLKNWQAQGAEVGIGYPSRHGRWLVINDAKWRWRAWFQPQDFLARTLPELAALADEAGQEADAIALLNSSDTPLEWPVTGLSYQVLQLGEIINGDQLLEDSMLWLKTAQGIFWFEQLPFDEQPRRESTLKFDNLPVLLDFLLGDSRISLTLLERINCGDVLLIQNEQSIVTSQGAVMGNFRRSDEEIMMEWNDDDALDQDVSYPDLGEAEEDFGNLPVRLEFVLHSETVMLSELRSIEQYNPLSLPVDAEKQVEIRANGMVLGRGELVQLEDRLGVEIHEWRNEAKDVE